MNRRLFMPGTRYVAGGVAAVLLAASVLGSTAAAPAARTATKAEHLDALAKIGRVLIKRLRPEVVDSLSAGGQVLVELNKNLDEVQDAAAAAKKVNAKVQGPQSLPKGSGNDPFAAEDLLTRLSGMTQSEVDGAWCQSNALLGYNDSGSFIATLFLAASPSASFSLNGWSRSTDRGGAYTDMGALVADPLPDGIMFRDLLGDPLVGCTNSSTFYYGSLAIDSGFDFSFTNSGISVSRSDDGGASFGPAQMAASKDGFTHFLDKPWMAVSPGPTSDPGDDVIHITYTDFDGSGFEDPDAACPNDARTAIEYVRSTDGGQTWSEPLVVEEVCGEFSFVQGSQVEVGMGDEVYVAWEHYADFDADRDIRIVKSSDGGETFGAANVISPVTPIGDGFAVQGQFRTFIDLQGLAVDRSSGAVYVSWHDGRNRTKVDPFGFCNAGPTYCFGDILLSRSADGGESWSDPKRVNDDNITLGVDQIFPAMDVDRSGNVWISYYDRRRDTRNLLIDTFVAKSTNAGKTFTNSRLTSDNFAPVTGWQDVVINPYYMGDYNLVAADSTGTYPGVIIAWGDNTLGDANIATAKR